MEIRVLLFERQSMMFAMNYTITVPADYDMRILRDRIARLGPQYDTLNHLVFKAFLITEAGVDGNPENSYAPFYVWQSEQGMHTFLSGDGFKGLTRTFGWPPVKTGIVHSLKWGHHDIQPVYATRECTSIVPHTDMSALWIAEDRLQEALLQSPHVFLNVVSFDPSNWILARFTLWDVLPEEICSYSGVQCLKLLHLAAPYLAARDS